MEKSIGDNIKELRTNAGLSQENIANVLNLSVQAISKWETGASLPDIMQMPRLAEYFDVSIDQLFYGLDYHNPTQAAQNNEEIEKQNSQNDTAYPEIPDDDKLRVVTFSGRKLLGLDSWHKDLQILLKTEPDNKINLEVWGNATIKGNIGGDAKAEGDINCVDIGNNANAGGSINCGDIGNNANAGGGINCEDIGNNANSGGAINCGDINYSASAGGTISCSHISGSANAGNNISCGHIDNAEHITAISIKCSGDISATTITCESDNSNVPAVITCSGINSCAQITADKISCKGDISAQTINSDNIASDSNIS